MFQLCRAGKRIVRAVRDRSIRALAFAKLLTNDLEICAKFRLGAGRTTGTIRVVF